MARLIEPSGEQEQELPSFMVVGLGASAGGVEALQSFFAHVPADSGAAYVVVLHLSPEYGGHLASILQSVALIPVTSVAEAVRVEPNHVYVVAPNLHLAMLDGTLAVSPSTQPEDRRAPIDVFFRTLAESHEARAACVILSGTGADGSIGLKRIKECGGVVFAQSPVEAGFDEMPLSAIATELVDEVLPIAAIPARISAYQASLGTLTIPAEAVPRSEDQQLLREVLAQLHAHTGHDFTNYKRSTLLRRIERCIGIRGLPDLPAYAALLRDNSDEARALLKDLLISVTRFFRDKEAFAALEHEILPRIFSDKRPDQQVRIWVVGCATGEEAYSIAMLFAERAFSALDMPSIQIFATDIDEAAIAHARAGLYTANETADVSPERLQRFFTAEGQRFRIRREIREMVLFATHNILKDPPFSRLDLVTCRNLLIYLNNTGQARVMEALNFALQPGGYLFLGTSESVDGASNLYLPVSREHHIFQSGQTSMRPPQVLSAMLAPRGGSLSLDAPAAEWDEQAREQKSYAELHQRLLEEYAPPSVMIDQNYEIVHLAERARRYLQVAGGEPSTNLLKLIRPELRLELRTALYQASQWQSNVDTSALPIRIDERAELVTLHVRPVPWPGDPARRLLLVLFEPGTPASGDAELMFRSEESIPRQIKEMVRLRQQLRFSSEQYELQTKTLEATNEELQALNEELRSSNKELENSQAELQSLNKELHTVNQDLEIKIEELTQTSANLRNLVNSTAIGTIFLDRGFRIKLFTSAARELFNLIPSDYDRPLADITHRLVDVDVLKDAEAVLDTLQTVEREVGTTTNQVFMLRMLPYRAAEDEIDGVVITFFDITERKRQEANLAFLAQVSADFAPRLGVDELMARAGERLAGYLNLSRCDFSAVDEASDQITTIYDWRRDEALPSVLGAHRISTFLSEIGRRQYLAGQISVINDTMTSPLLNNSREVFQQLGIRAVVDVPYLENSSWKFLISACRSQPSAWRADEVELIRELTARVYLRLERARTEEDLRQSEQRLQLLIENLPGAVAFIVDRDLRYLLAAGDALAPAGFKPEDLVGKTIFEVLTPDLLANYITYYRQALAGEVFLHEHDAHGRSYISRGAPLRSASGDVYAVLVISYDITERKRAEAAMLESEERLRTLSDVVPQLIWTNDAAGRANYFNQRWYDYSGLSYEQSAGPGWQAIVHPDDAQTSIERWRHSQAAGQVFEAEYRLRRADGVYRWHLARNVPLHDAGGQVAGWFGSATDIEELKRAEAARRESDERFRLLVEGARDFAMFLLDLDNRITFWSAGAERLFGWPEPEALGQSGTIIFTPEDRERGVAEHELSTALRDGRAQDRRWHLRKDGTRLFIDGAMIRLDDDDGRPSGFVKVGRDATVQHEAEQALQRAREELEQRVAERTEALSTANAQLQAEIAARAHLERNRQDLLRQLVTAQEDERRRIARELHDQLGQEITGILLQLKLLQQSVPPDEAQAEQIQNITDLTQRLASEAHQLAIELRPTALDDVGLAAALRHYVGLWTERTRLAADLQLDGLDERRLPPEIETVVYRVVQEALTNVIKHAQAKRVGIILLVHGGAVQLIVEDDGQGFDSEAPVAAGSLGLASMRERVEQVGGSFSLESAPGAGATVYARIPLPAA